LSIIEMDRTTAEERKKIDDEVTQAAIENAKARGVKEIEIDNQLIENKKSYWEIMGQLSKEAADKERIRREQEKADQLEFQNASFDLAKSSINALMQINEAAAGQSEASQRKAFERNKKLQIAQALISGAQGIVNIWSSPSTIPQPYDAIYKGIQTAVLVALTATQISKIKKAKFSGGGGSTGGGVPNLNGTGGGSAPGLAPVSNTSTVVPQGDQQVFVTETDISATQNKVSVIEDQATIQ